MPLDYSLQGPVAVIRWDEGENRISLETVAVFEAILDELDAIEGPLGVVVTGAGRFFCNGVDIDRSGTDSRLIEEIVRRLSHLIGRLLVYPAYTVAAINGHAYGAGAILTSAFDYRVMRADRGYWCVNEIEIGWPLDDRLWKVMAHRVPFATAVTAATTAQRYTGAQALLVGIVDDVADTESLVRHAIEKVERHSELDRTVLGHVKRLAHGSESLRLGFSD